jgi:hypothetical protein
MQLDLPEIPNVWLLDEGLPVPLFACLKRLGVEVQTAEFRQWKGLRNGNLVMVATEAGFLAILTKDRLFAQDATKALVNYPKMAIVLVQLPQKPRRQYIETFEDQWKKSKIIPVAGRVIEWPK